MFDGAAYLNVIDAPEHQTGADLALVDEVRDWLRQHPSRETTNRPIRSTAEDDADNGAILGSMGALIEAWALRLTDEEAKQIAELSVRVDLLYRELSTHKVRTLATLALKRIAQQTQAELADAIQAMKIARQP